MLLPRPLFTTFVSAPLCAAALALGGCATTPYTGPVEVTRFVGPAAAELGRGTIALAFPEEMSNRAARTAIAQALQAELTRLGYTVVPEGASADQTAIIRTSRAPIAAAPVDRRGPVDVGVGGSTGSYGSGLGVGVGINLGGGREGPAVNTSLEVRITRSAGETLWEGRAQMETGVKSPYSPVETSARTLAAGLFRDFPGGNGETVTINVNQLQGTK